MRKYLLIGIILFSTISFAQQKKTEINLNSDFQMKIGDYSALLLNNLLISKKYYIDAPILCTFDSISRTIDLEIFGARHNVEGARESMNKYWEVIDKLFIPYITKKFNVTLEKKDFRILYFDRNARNGAKLILQLIDGHFIVPDK